MAPKYQSPFPCIDNQSNTHRWPLDAAPFPRTSPSTTLGLSAHPPTARVLAQLQVLVPYDLHMQPQGQQSWPSLVPYEKQYHVAWPQETGLQNGSRSTQFNVDHLPRLPTKTPTPLAARSGTPAKPGDWMGSLSPPAKKQFTI